ncbi:hypothetical protein CUN63_05545 [Pseudomonas sp. ACM7]|nr:hypothetical protein CUN63_05545 [Pseudomonas sp. ACM7]
MYRMMSICSSCRACEAAFGCVAVVNPAYAVCLTYRNLWFYDCYAAERSLAGSAAATKSESTAKRGFTGQKKTVHRPSAP